MNRLNGYTDSFVNQTGFRQHGGFYSGIALGDIILQSSGQVSISGTNVSLTVGEREKITYVDNYGWSAKQPYLTTGGPNSDGVFPIAISGIYSIDMAYRANREIRFRTPYGNLYLIADELRPVFVGTGRSPMQISGMLAVPLKSSTNQNNQEGDVFMCHHSVIGRPPKLPNSNFTPYTPPDFDFESDARSLGHATMAYNTGSGIINLMVGSGIYYGSALSNNFLVSTTEYPNRIRFFDQISDANFAFDTGPTGVRIFTPGLYRARYNVTVEKQSGTNIRTIASRAVVYHNNEDATIFNGDRTVPGSISFASAQNTSNWQRASMCNEFLFNADAGDFIAVEAFHIDLSGAANGFVISPSGSNIIIQKIGPKRGTF